MLMNGQPQFFPERRRGLWIGADEKAAAELITLSPSCRGIGAAAGMLTDRLSDAELTCVGCRTVVRNDGYLAGD